MLVLSDFSPFSGLSLFLGGDLCLAYTSTCVHSGDCDLCLLLPSLLSESSSESYADDPLSLCLLFEGYLPIGGDVICGICGLGHVLCHSGGDIGPYKCISVVLYSSPTFFVYKIKSSSPISMRVLKFGFACLLS